MGGGTQCKTWCLQQIDAAMRRALTITQGFSLDVRIVSFGAPPSSMLALEKTFS
jgi:hypothetical protein